MKRSEEREYNIRRVIHTAQMLFIADGISATPISRIAEASGLTPTSLYRYFRNKDALVFAAWRDALETFFADFMEQYAREAASCKTGYEKFVVCMHIYFRIYDRRPEWYDYTREMFSAYSEKGTGSDVNNVPRCEHLRRREVVATLGFILIRTTHLRGMCPHVTATNISAQKKKRG